MARSKIREFLQRNRRLSILAIAAFFVIAILLIPLSYTFAHWVAAAPRGAFGLPVPLQGGAGTLSPDILETPGGFTLPEPWSGADRVTILLMGLDYRDWSAGEGPSRTDTMILLSVDPVTKTASILSIPRDLWAVIPGFSPNKINTAHYYGELYKVPGGGPELAMRTVEQTIGIPIDYYARIDFNAFIKFIDLIGGVKIDVPEPITVDPLGADTQPKNLKPGIQTLPGAVALAYARERHVKGGDFSRAERQQQIILGIRNRILEFNLLPGLIANAPQIYAELSAGISSNLSLEDAIQLAVLASQIDSANIKRGVINEKYVIFGRSPDDLSILIPIPDKIRELRDEIFTGNAGLGPLTPGSPEERLAAEAPRISIQNGTSDGSLGGRTQAFLAGLGANIVEVRATGSALSQTILVDHTGNPYTLAYLSQLMGVESSRIIHEFDPTNSIDVEIRLGNDWLASNSLP
ncbi:MAG TPA: LCP family protein [Anaerolineales bacterium]|nr:LCP family protein [Anaerolineales bacterium]